LSEIQKSLVAKAHRAQRINLESGMAANAGRWSLGDSIDRHEVPESLLEADDECAILLRHMDRLDARERSILALRYGLEEERPLTFKEIDRRMGVTREWVRKIERRARRKLGDDRGDRADLKSGSMADIEFGSSPARPSESHRVDRPRSGATSETRNHCQIREVIEAWRTKSRPLGALSRFPRMGTA
jgi:hypothetical protein